MEGKSICGSLEAILFAEGGPMELDKLALATGLEKKEVKAVLEEMQKTYESPERGIKLISLENAWQLVTKETYYDELIVLESHPTKPVLTDVMMETLSIVAYKQPVTRNEIERIRGVSSEHSINRLLEYNLICEVGRLNAPGKPIVFGTTDEFLRKFGFDSVRSLPHLDPVHEVDLQAEAETEAGLQETDEADQRINIVT